MPFLRPAPGNTHEPQHAWANAYQELLAQAFRQFAVEGRWTVFEGKPYWAPSDEVGSYWGSQFPVDLELGPLDFAAAFEPFLGEPEIRDHLHAWKTVIEVLLSRCSAPDID